MKFGKLFLCTLAAASLFVGCKEKEENLGAPSLELSESSIAFEESSAASKVITVTASRDWKAECAETWISVGPESGSASADPQNVTISVIANDGASRTATVTFTIGTVQKNLTVTQKGQPVIDGSSILEETFASSFGSFTPDNTKVWTVDTKYKYAMATAYNVDGAPSESWLVSSVIDLTGEGAATLSFEHACNYFASADAAKENATVWAKVDGSDSWEQLTVPVYSDNSGWTFVASGDVDLSKYLGSKIQIGFKYTIGTKAGTWEIKNLKIVRSTAKKTLKVSTEGLAVNADATSTTFGIQSNTDWTVESNSADFTVSPASGSGDATITVSFSENTSEESEKTAVITVSGTDADPVTVTITQAVKPAGNATVVTVNTNSADLQLTDDQHSVYGAGYYLTQDGVKIGNYKYESTSNVNSSYTTPIRVYKSSALYVEVPEGNVITSVKLDCDPGNVGYIEVITDGNKKIDPQGSVLTWTGTTSDNTFAAKMSEKQVRVKSVEVTYVPVE